MRTAALAVVLATATAGTVSASPIRGDVEVDPTAYALSGNSIHVGISRGHVRLDLGNFGLALPRWIHGNADFDASFDGFGAKLQYFPRADQLGWFAGVDTAAIFAHVRRRGTDLAADDTSLSVGVHAGYRIALPSNLYVTPWLGVGYNAGVDDLMLDGKRFRGMPVSVFPAVHLGYRFR